MSVFYVKIVVSLVFLSIKVVLNREYISSHGAGEEQDTSPVIPGCKEAEHTNTFRNANTFHLMFPLLILLSAAVRIPQTL